MSESKQSTKDNGFALTRLKFADLTAAWHGVNDYMGNCEKEIRKKGGTISGSELASYNNMIMVERCKLDPYFNFGKILGYQSKKWSKLLNNYCNYNYLDLIRNEIVERERKRSSSYNYTYHFDNVHGSGKDCLISLTFSRRRNHPRPIVYFYTRASEVTKRLAFDFLLIQRMTEYIYGKKAEVELICHIPFMFINMECYLMYVSSMGGVKYLRKENGKYTHYQEKLIKKYEFFLETDLEKIKYKVHTRAARQVKNWNGEGEFIPDLFAKQLKLTETIKRKETHINKLNKETGHE